jgi:DNA-binding response OmpR family regulator
MQTKGAAMARRRQVLVVEDEDSIARLIQIYLESVGFSVRKENMGQDALDYAAENRPDLVVLDLRLPDIHGYKVCQELRKIYNAWSVPILILTGLDQPIDQLRAFAHGADAYLTKPFEPSELIEAVTMLLGSSSVN